MLSYALAIAVAISSLILFSTAFFMSKIHRKDDFLWSAVGLFYALILWFCARNITGTVLLGQAAATVLITSYCWQTIKLRKLIANPEQATEAQNFSVTNSLSRLFKRKPKLNSPTAPVAPPPTPKVTEQEIAIPETPATPPPVAEVAVPAVNVVEQSVKPEAAVADPQTMQETELVTDAGRNSEPIAKAQPLPTKLPDAQNSTQTQSVDKLTPADSTVPPVTQVDELVAEAAAAVNPEPQTSKDAISKTEPTPELITSEVKTESAFEALETVEVAEVLEAEVDNSAERRESESDNIIEVTTTEINVVTETKKIDRTQANDADLQDE